MPAIVRFLDRVTFDGDCLVWTGGKHGAGYGWFSLGYRRRVLAHRFSYETFVGPIPADLNIDHLCRNRLCVHPFHLEAVTPRENSLRGHAPNILLHHTGVCLRGHTRQSYMKNGKGGRYCLDCLRDRARARTARRKAAA